MQLMMMYSTVIFYGNDIRQQVLHDPNLARIQTQLIDNPEVVSGYTWLNGMLLYKNKVVIP